MLARKAFENSTWPLLKKRKRQMQTTSCPKSAHTPSRKAVENATSLWVVRGRPLLPELLSLVVLSKLSRNIGVTETFLDNLMMSMTNLPSAKPLQCQLVQYLLIRKLPVFSNGVSSHRSVQQYYCMIWHLCSYRLSNRYQNYHYNETRQNAKMMNSL